MHDVERVQVLHTIHYLVHNFPGLVLCQGVNGDHTKQLPSCCPGETEKERILIHMYVHMYVYVCMYICMYVCVLVNMQSLMRQAIPSLKATPIAT